MPIYFIIHVDISNNDGMMTTVLALSEDLPLSR
jgi:hypothetical protein